MGAKVEVEEVVQAAPDGLVREAAIDRPRVGSRPRAAAGGWSLDVRGWAVGGPAPVSQVELSLPGAVVARVPCEPWGDGGEQSQARAGSRRFHATLSALDLPREFELRLDALVGDEGRARIGTIRGSRAALATGFEPRMQPLMLTGPGRAGSTIFMQMLAAHPGIAAYPPFQGEPRVVTYWLDVARALARPQSWMRQMTPPGRLTGTWWLGEGDHFRSSLRPPSLHAWFAGQAVEDIAAFAQSRIEATYAQFEAAQDKSGSKFFAEKVHNGLEADLVWELYPGAREVVIVRDPRDVLASILASREKRRLQPMPADPVRWVGESFAGRIMIVVDSMRRRGERAHLVRYEDLMGRPEETLAEVLAYLGLDAAPATVSALLAAAGNRVPRMDAHRTTADPAASIGRWRTDLAPEVAQACERAVAPAFEAWGYEPGGAPAAR